MIMLQVKFVEMKASNWTRNNYFYFRRIREKHFVYSVTYKYNLDISANET